MTTDEAIIALAQGNIKGTVLVVNAADVLAALAQFVVIALVAWGVRTLWSEYLYNTRNDKK